MFIGDIIKYIYWGALRKNKKTKKQIHTYKKKRINIKIIELEKHENM